MTTASKIISSSVIAIMMNDCSASTWIRGDPGAEEREAFQLEKDKTARSDLNAQAMKRDQLIAIEEAKIDNLDEKIKDLDFIISSDEPKKLPPGQADALKKSKVERTQLIAQRQGCSRRIAELQGGYDPEDTQRMTPSSDNNGKSGGSRMYTLNCLFWVLIVFSLFV